MRKVPGKNWLAMKWNKKEKDFMIYYPNKRDGSLLHNYFSSQSKWLSGDIKESLQKELENRGYDLETLYFEIKLKDKDE